MSLNDNDKEDDKAECKTFVSQRRISNTYDEDRIPPKTNAMTFVLCACFGMGTWLPVNAIYSQMSILTQSSPETWSLPSHFSIVVQSANIVPLLYYLNKRRLIVHEYCLINCTLLVGTISILGLAFTQNVTFYVYDKERSILFFIFSFFCAGTGCASSLLFIPFLNYFSQRYLTAFFLGEGLCNLIPAILAFVQHNYKISCFSSVHSNVAFNSRTFFLIISFFTFLSLISFRYLNRFRAPGRITVNKTKPIQREHLSGNKIPLKLLLILQTVVSFFECGILTSIQSYSCLPYGQHAYQWAISLNQVFQPLMMYLAMYVKLTSIRLLGIMCVTLAIFLAYELLTAFLSPIPPLQGHKYGAIHIVLVWLVGSILISYIKLSIATIIRQKWPQTLFLYGVGIQIGASTGAALSFILINYTSILKSTTIEMCR